MFNVLQVVFPSLSLGVVSLHEGSSNTTDLVLNEVKLVHIKLIYNETASYNTELTITVDDNDALQLCSVNVVDVGLNLGCVKKEILTATSASK